MNVAEMLGEVMPGGDIMSLDAKAAYVQLLAIADHARQLRQEPKICTLLEVDGILGAYAAARTLCHEVACGEKATVSLPDLGCIAEDKQYNQGELRGILIGIEVECLKGVGALASVIALTSKEESAHE